MTEIEKKYASLGGPSGFLGAPQGPEMKTQDGIGAYRHYQGGSIYWTQKTGAHEVHREIRAKWSALGSEKSALGYPLTDETATPGSVCRYNHFQHGSIYWSPETGAREAKRGIKMHIKILTSPNVSLDLMLGRMQQVYSIAGIRVEICTTENLNAPTLDDLDAGGCLTSSPTYEQKKLFNNRNNAGPNDIVVYFVRSTNPPYNGCAAYPDGKPGAVVAKYATVWTLAHEIGHVLGLGHVNDNNRLMTGNGTAFITNPPPDLIASEIAKMQSSKFTFKY